MGKNSGSFKSVPFGGFDKQEVENFISRINERKAEAETEYESKIRQLSTDKGQLNAVIFDLKETIKHHETKNSELDEKIKILNLEISRQHSELDNLREQIIKKDSEVKKVETEKKELLERNKYYQTMSLQIADTMLDAKNTATQIIDDAHKNAELIQGEAINTVDNISNVINEFKDDIVNLKSFVRNMTTNIIERVENLELSIVDAEKRIKKNYIEATSKSSAKTTTIPLPQPNATKLQPLQPPPDSPDNISEKLGFAHSPIISTPSFPNNKNFAADLDKKITELSPNPNVIKNDNASKKTTIFPKFTPESQSKFAPDPQNKFTPDLQNKFTPDLQNKFAPDLQNKFAPDLQNKFAPDLQNKFAPDLQKKPSDTLQNFIPNLNPEIKPADDDDGDAIARKLQQKEAEERARMMEKKKNE